MGWIPRPQLAGNLEPARVRQSIIENGRLQTPAVRERLGRRVAHDDLVPRRREGLDEVVGQIDFVVHDERLEAGRGPPLLRARARVFGSAS